MSGSASRQDDRDYDFPPSEQAVSQSAAVARSALEHWTWSVRGMPFAVESDESRPALRGLAAWYERISVDDAYTNPAPAAGVEALEAEVRGPDRLPRSLQVAHWAVRVAQELAECRRTRLGAVDLAATCLAEARLDVAVQGAFDHLRRSWRDGKS